MSSSGCRRVSKCTALESSVTVSCHGPQANSVPSPQEEDDLVSPDVLSTVREMDVANFRRVPRMPIYGTAQPSAKVPASNALVHTWGQRKGCPCP